MKYPVPTVDLALTTQAPESQVTVTAARMHEELTPDAPDWDLIELQTRRSGGDLLASQVAGNATSMFRVLQTAGACPRVQVIAVPHLEKPNR